MKWILFLSSKLQKILSRKPKKKNDLAKHKKALIPRSVSNYWVILSNLNGMILKNVSLFLVRNHQIEDDKHMI